MDVLVKMEAVVAARREQPRAGRANGAVGIGRTAAVGTTTRVRHS